MAPLDTLPPLPPPPERPTQPCAPQEPYAVLCERARLELLAAWREAEAGRVLGREAGEP